jgi:hypothetical protein
MAMHCLLDTFQMAEMELQCCIQSIALAIMNSMQVSGDAISHHRRLQIAGEAMQCRLLLGTHMQGCGGCCGAPSGSWRIL